MKIQTSPYSLLKKNKINAKDNSNFINGVLIKVIEDGFWGVADLCTHPSLGDLDVDQELVKKGSLYKRAIELAKEDLLARKQNRSLLQDKWLSNNYLITDYKNTNLNDSKYLKKTIKLKGDVHVTDLVKLVNSIDQELVIRIDFNNSLTPDLFELFLSLIDESVKEKIEYIEDPTEFCEQWKSWQNQVTLAYDFQKNEYRKDWAEYQIIKPTRQVLASEAMAKVTLTSAMGHPVGVAHGLRLAQQFAKNESGFLTLDLFDSHEFANYFLVKDNLVNFSKLATADTGIGMTDLLNRLSWVSHD